ncbi:hypothetical protein OAU25_00380 [Crocinitomicaceae bacterium]|nr:hypothetical protein [Crocinitomicaceae bacterium]
MKLVTVTLAAVLLYSCQNKETTSCDEDYQIKLKELELKEKELDLKEEELGLKTQEINAIHQDGGVMSAVTDQTSPRWVVEQIFYAASTKNFDVLSNYCDPEGEGDGDTRDICSIAEGSAEMKESFCDYFKDGVVVGSPEIKGDYAEVEILFGPDSEQSETFILVNRRGNWYLFSL